MPEPELEALERWTQVLIMHPLGVAAGARSPEAHAALQTTLEAQILPSRQLQPEQRVGIYASMYFERLLEVLEEDFPALCARLGQETAQRVFHDYLVAHPSRHYSLNMLGARLADFLRDGGSDVEQRSFVAELARLERTLQEVFDAQESPHLTTDEFLAVPPEAWPTARLVPIQALRLLAFEYPIDAWFQAWRDGTLEGVPGPSPSWLAVYRSAERIWRLPLSRAAHALLVALVEQKTLGEAVLESARASGTELEALGPLVQDWFQAWTADGLFASVSV